MSEFSRESVYYDFETKAMNYPATYLQNPEGKPRRADLSPEMVNLLKLRAYLSQGDYPSASAMIEKLNTQLAGSTDYFLLARLYLLRYFHTNSVSQNPKVCHELLAQAAKYQQRSLNVHLETEVLICKYLAEADDHELTHNEDILARALRIATESDDLRAIIQVYLGYIYLYQTLLLPDLANRELQMLQEICKAK